jgi:hypothetical protein
MSRVVSMLCAALLLCSAGCDRLGQDGCLSDTECKGDRTCSEGVCVGPALGLTGDLMQPSMAGAAAEQPVGDGDDAGADADPASTAADASLTSDAGATAKPAPGPVPQPDEEYICEPGGPGACQNDNDCVLIRDGSAKDTAKTCGIECATSVNASCAKDCIQMRTPIGDACADCLDLFFDCILSQCLGPCASGTAEQCAQCSRDKPAGNSCSDQWYACSGTSENPDYVSQ